MWKHRELEYFIDNYGGTTNSGFFFLETDKEDFVVAETKEAALELARVKSGNSEFDLEGLKQE